MFELAFSILSVFLLVNFCHVQDYNVGVDEIFKRLIGPVYEVKKTTHDFDLNVTRSNISTKSTRKVKVKFLNKGYYQGNTSDVIDSHKERRHGKDRRPGIYTKDQLDVEAIINNPEEKPIPDFNVDPFKTLSRRFDVARTQYMQYRGGKQALREIYFYDEYVDLVKKQKIRVLGLQEQFLYESRYKLVYGQRLRKKYRRKFNYQLGYCFALLRNMKQQQYVIFATMHSNRMNYTSYYHFLKMYERIIRLDIDLKDLVRFMKYLDFMAVFHNLSERPYRYRRMQGFITIENDTTTPS